MKITDEMVEAALDFWHDGDFPSQFDRHEEIMERASMRAALEAALAAAPQAEQEPVAWRWLSSDGLEWLFVERKEWAPDIKGVEVEPLYTAPQPAPDDALREAAKQALEAIRLLGASEDITYLRGTVALALIEAEDELEDALREALGDR